MRQAGTVPTERDARRLADYLLTQGIETKAEPDGDGFALWIRDEDRLDEAQRTLEEYRQSPEDPRYVEAHQKAQSVRGEKRRQEKVARKNYVDVRTMWSAPASRRPLTIGLILASIAVTVLTDRGQQIEPVFSKLAITEVRPVGLDRIQWTPGLPEIHRGEVWRLVTPMLLHMGWLHLIFNMLWMLDLGSQIEVRRGTWRLALIVLISAAVSNWLQYWYPLQFQGDRLFKPNPLFGGMSGVVYAMLGYVWMKTRLEPRLGLYLDPSTVTFMLIWLVVCFTGWLGPIANTAHLAGLLVGVAIGAGTYGVRRLTSG